MGQTDSPYLQAWFLFIGDDGQLSTDRAAARVSVGALRSGRVRLRVPDGLDLAPDVADKIAVYLGEAALIAEESPDKFRPLSEQQGTADVGALTSGQVRIAVDPDLDMPPTVAARFAQQIADAATLARSACCGCGTGQRCSCVCHRAGPSMVQNDPA